jgi:hypothetical protein
MTATPKTDHSDGALQIKVEMRRGFLSRLPKKPISVLDCCSGSGRVWKRLAGEFELKVLRLDKKKLAGVLKMDSNRFLTSQPLYQYDVVDIDTYGEPWRLFSSLVENTQRRELVVFLTYGFMQKAGGCMSAGMLGRIGIPEDWNLDGLYQHPIRWHAIQKMLAGLDLTMASIEGRKYYFGFILPQSFRQEPP